MINKISIVVPIYNVENYLERCINSLINQTYKDIEIILVNDGSTDNSLKICERYKSIDNRILLLNKKNGGLSDARNFGMKYVTGNYVLFVDSDDYLYENSCEILNNTIKEYKHADLVFFNFNQIINGEIQSYRGSNKIFSISKDEVYRRYLYGEGIYNSAWSKMYKTEIALKIHFPKGKKAEDLATTYKFINLSKNYIFIDKAFYFYDRRDDSIMGKQSIDLIFDILEFAKEKYNFERENFPEYKKQSLSLYVNCILKTLRRLNEENLENEARTSCENELESINLFDLKLKTQIALIIYKINKRLFFELSKKFI